MRINTAKQPLWLGVIGVIVFFGVAWLVWPFLYMFVTDDGRSLRVQLLYKTNHEALLQACRVLSQRVEAGSLRPDEYQIRPDPVPEVCTFPKFLLDLKPRYIIVNADGSIVLAMAGGLDHFGIKAYPEGYKRPPLPDFEFGDKELLDGLWYYDDGYRELGADYEKRIGALRPKGRAGVSPRLKR